MIIIKNKKMLIIFAVLFVVILAAISLLGRSNYFLKEKNIRLMNQDGKVTNYKINKDILVISTTCAVCRDELEKISRLSAEKQKSIDIISLSSYDDICKLLKNYKIYSSFFADEYGEFKSKYDIVIVPKRYRCVEGKLVKSKLEGDW